MVPRPAAILGVTRETPDTFTLSLDLGDRADGFPFAPGQFNMLYQFGMGEVPISISGDPARPQKLVHTIRAAGTVTQAMLSLRKGACLGVRGPYGSPWPLEAARGRDVVLIAGGIGLAPLRPVIYQILHRRADYERVCILYGARSPGDMLYKEELERWRGRFDVSVHVIVDRGGLHWKGNVGVVTALLPRARFDPVDSVAMLCGPEIMMRYCVRELQQHGLPDERIWVSMERNMRCAVGFCGHCQFGPTFVCKDGPVYRFDRIARIFGLREI
jgi:NAD(P)H-flavin reductase